MKRLTLAASLAAVLVSGAAMAESGKFGIGVNYGLLSGAGLEGTYVINPMFQARASISGGMDLSATDKSGDFDYAYSLKNGQKRLALDWHPFEGNFFVSGGYAINDYALQADATAGTAGQKVSIGNDSYTVVNPVSLRATANWSNAPTLSFGWGNSPEKGFGFLFEAGMIYTGAATYDLVATKGTANAVIGGTAYNNLDLTTDPRVKASLAAEKAKVEKNVAQMDFLPILQLGLNYRF
jgi:hypothetical protein